MVPLCSWDKVQISKWGFLGPAPSGLCSHHGLFLSFFLSPFSLSLSHFNSASWISYRSQTFCSFSHLWVSNLQSGSAKTKETVRRSVCALHPRGSCHLEWLSWFEWQHFSNWNCHFSVQRKPVIWGYVIAWYPQIFMTLKRYWREFIWENSETL
jgi:hypothetical protein